MIPSVNSESSEHHRATGFCRSGTIVLSSSFRLLFSDQRAIELMATLDSDISDPPLTEAFPSCLRRVAQEIVAADSLRKDSSSSWFEQSCRLVGSHTYPVQVRGFSVPGQNRADGRIVLVLSCRHEHTAQYLHGPSESNSELRETGLSQSNLPVGDRLIV